jgi:hypothetical protein
MLDLSRRNFLKGLMASAGVAAVGIPLHASTVSLAPILPDVEGGDLWLKVDDVWRFIGKAISFERRQDYDTIHDSSCIRKPVLVHHRFDGDVRMVWDHEGQGILSEIFFRARESHEAIFGAGEHQFHMTEFIVHSMANVHEFGASRMLWKEISFSAARDRITKQDR